MGGVIADVVVVLSPLFLIALSALGDLGDVGDCTELFVAAAAAAVVVVVAVVVEVATAGDGGGGFGDRSEATPLTPSLPARRYGVHSARTRSLAAHVTPASRSVDKYDESGVTARPYARRRSVPPQMVPTDSRSGVR